jgi:hypothetical protein
MKRWTIACIIILSSVRVYAQWEVSAGAGYGTFAMKDMHKLHELILTQSIVKSEVTDAFPGHIIYQAAVMYRFRRNHFLGLSYQFGSTGGRVYYSDYSGSLYSDQLLRYTQLAVNLGETVRLGKDFFVMVDLQPGVTFSKLLYKSRITIGEGSAEESAHFHSINWVVEPTFTLLKQWGKFGARLSAGYHVDAYSGKFKVKGGEGWLTNGYDPVHADWNGLRTTVGATMILSRNGRDKASN